MSGARIRWAAVLAAALVIIPLPSTLSAASERDAACPDAAPRRERKSITVPTDDYPTIQSAVCDVAPGGTVRIKSGEYEGPIWIVKPVTLAGLAGGRGDERPVLSSPAPPRVVSSDEAVGVLNVLGGTSLAVTGVELRGGDAGIVSRDDGRGGVQSVDVTNVRIADAGRGILHVSSGQLSLKQVDISYTLGNAVSAFGPIGGSICGVKVSQSDFLSHGEVGLYVRNCQVDFDSSTVVGFLGGGLKAYASTVSVKNSQFSFNRYFSMLFFNSQGSVEQTNTFVTDCGPFDPSDPNSPCTFGDGITAMTSASAPGAPTSLSIVGNYIFGSAHAAIGVYGAHVALGDNTMQNQAFDLDVEVGLDGAPMGTIDDLGGNLCDTSGSGFDTCISVSSGKGPPGPIDSGP